MQRLFLKWNPEKVQRFLAPRWTDRGCCSCSVIARRYCNFANRLWGKSDISTLPNSKRNPNMRMLRQIEEIKELWIFSTFFQQMRACYCWLAKPNASLFWKTVWDLLHAKFQNVLHSEDFSLNSCVTLIIIEKCHTVWHLRNIKNERKIQDSRFKILYFALFISSITVNILIKMRRKKRTEFYLLHEKKERCVVTILSSKCFRDGHYHMALRERKIFVISWHTRCVYL